MSGPRPTCAECGVAYATARHALGYRTCTQCGDKQARQQRFTVMPAYSKGAYQLVSPQDVAHTNPKR